uniref:AT9S n=1 Tax=Mycobacterium tuberculosis TaxID=1773 RepID=Q50578_MYCTX|nr:AT9S [Mycobacterium tuberculosis]
MALLEGAAARARPVVHRGGDNRAAVLVEITGEPLAWESRLVMVVEYCIAGDDGSAGIWNRPFDVNLDGDGRLDAIGLDLDGDGLRDDALADFDGDDVADHAVFDVDNDGTPESYFIDTIGTWRSPSTAADNCAGMASDGLEQTGAHWLTSKGSVL